MRLDLGDLGSDETDSDEKPRANTTRALALAMCDWISEILALPDALIAVSPAVPLAGGWGEGGGGC